MGARIDRERAGPARASSRDLDGLGDGDSWWRKRERPADQCGRLRPGGQPMANFAVNARGRRARQTRRRLDGPGNHRFWRNRGRCSDGFFATPQSATALAFLPEVMNSIFLRRLFALWALLILTAAPARAFWKQETFVLKPGWNAIYLFIDPSHVDLSALIPASVPIDEVWHWRNLQATDRYIATFQNPSDPNVDWAHWKK